MTTVTWPAREHDAHLTGLPDEPWWTRRAITWMDQYLSREMSVVEWGAGASTPWLAARCGRLRSIDNNPAYRDMAEAALRELGFPPDRYSVEVRPLGPVYYECVRGERFDVAVIDGRLRVPCCERAIQVLVPGGILLLDNAERSRYEKARSLLSCWPVVETSNGIWCTNLYRKPNAQ